MITPLIYKTELWKTSGHYEAFRDDMFLMRADEDEYGVKPMNCPGHCYLFATRKHSYRDLPIRYADFSRLHRFEPSGTLPGLTRVRSFAQDDAHIYCTPEQVDAEVGAFIAMVREVYDAFGFDRVEVTLQTRPEKFLGPHRAVGRAPRPRSTARRAQTRLSTSPMLPGEGAFYGPKIGFDFRDVLERELDARHGPDRLRHARALRASRYVTPEGTEATPVMIHRAVLGSIERFIAILLEHTAGKLPLWLAPVQVRVLPVSEKVGGVRPPRGAGVRRRRPPRRGRRPQREARLQDPRGPAREDARAWPWSASAEQADGTVAPRIGGEQPNRRSPLDAFIARVDGGGSRMPGGAP